MKYKVTLIVLLLMMVGCEVFAPKELEEYELLDGPLEGLTYAETKRFVAGDAAFDNQIFTAETGLGPIFTGTSCISCHAGEGKGHPYNQFIRFGQSDATGNHYLDQGGPQLQNKALPGYEPEALPPGAPHATFIAQAVTGLGYFDAVTDEYLLQIEEEQAKRTDGIRGQVHWNEIPEYVNLREGTITRNGKYITRFGKKASIYDLLQQTAFAYNQDIGITSYYEPYDTYSGEMLSPEIDRQTINDVVFYLKTLKAPEPRNQDNLDVLAGKNLFEQINCAVCHRPTMETGYSPIEPLSYQTFHPYTDLLLHDLGSDLNDGYTEGYATSGQWRTAALWGLGLSKDSQGGSYYLMHDGRAKSIEEAIAWHGGEAEESKKQFELLTLEEKKQVIKFLESL